MYVYKVQRGGIEVMQNSVGLGTVQLLETLHNNNNQTLLGKDGYSLDFTLTQNATQHCQPSILASIKKHGWGEQPS